MHFPIRSAENPNCALKGNSSKYFLYFLIAALCVCCNHNMYHFKEYLFHSKIDLHLRIFFPISNFSFFFHLSLNYCSLKSIFYLLIIVSRVFLTFFCLQIQEISNKESLLKFCYQYKDADSPTTNNHVCVRLNKLSLSRIGCIENLMWVQMLDLSHNELRSIEGTWIQIPLEIKVY